MRAVEELNKNELITENLTLVERVIRKYIRINESIQGLGYDDLYQAGCLALCSAADTYIDSGVPFAAYAGIVVKNKLIDHCRLVLRQHHNQLYLDNSLNCETDGHTFAELIQDCRTNYLEGLETSEILSLLDSVKPAYSGVTLKGIEAIELKVKGYTGKEIAKLYGVSSNNVGAWISRAAARLRNDRLFLNGLGLGP